MACREQDFKSVYLTQHYVAWGVPTCFDGPIVQFVRLMLSAGDGGRVNEHGMFTFDTWSRTANMEAVGKIVAYCWEGRLVSKASKKDFERKYEKGLMYVYFDDEERGTLEGITEDTERQIREIGRCRHR